MKYLNSIYLLVGLCFCSCNSNIVTNTNKESSLEEKLIDRATLFASKNKEDVKLSPNGNQLSFIQLKGGIRNIWIASLNNIDAAKQVTFSTKRDVFYDYYWSTDGASIIYKGDNGGDENYVFRAISLKTNKTTVLSPLDGSRTQLYGISPKHPKEIILGYNNRDPSYFDLYRVNIESGKRELIYKNTKGFNRFYIDTDLKLRMARKPATDAPYYMLYKCNESKEFQPFYRIELEESRTYKVLQFDFSDDFFYALDNKETDKLALVRINFKTGERKQIASSKKVDLKDVIFSSITGKPILYLEDYLKPEWHWLNEQKFMFPESFTEQRIRFLGFNNNENKCLIKVSGKHPGKIYIIEKGKEEKFLFSEKKELENYELPEVIPVTIKSRDGLDLVCYLSLPKGSDSNMDGIPDKPLPMILNPHDGPWRRTHYNYDTWWQWMANRGYAVLSPNFRGSTGFGKDFLNAGNMEWGAKMQDDLDDAVDWAIRVGIANPDKIGMFGASYSGYTSLMALAKSSDKYACAIDMFGPSNLETLLNSLPKYWMIEFEEIVKRMGDPRTEEGRAFLKERSPITYARDFKKPLLIAQGENDIRVTRQESDQIAAALSQNNIPVTYLLLKDEGHGWFNTNNDLALKGLIEDFLAKHLGGRVEGLKDQIDKSSIEFVKTTKQ
ncbi:S9 family peptidase [Ichthyenterobacterium magnum]|uniref:Dipeptidyl aminopeptidase/acylaminoacyl peptidase n=1 Tax=Ichthyenterobacterium magnum TaxID=1230530 RepID=A0A420DKL9_9FLAO|nr:S9 family peptidase [Ichthyenterobacterium magnum]RKE94800.1 dipeptidyl aminopeptidase/acylaminoacyl peptidase [Ichthyenterobacterium magnum]